LAIFQDTDALPLDIFRILVGLLSLAYFLRTLVEAVTFSGPDGLIDHQLSQRIFGFTGGGLFRAGMPVAAFQLVFLVAALASCALILGYRVKFAAAIAYAIAVMSYRWNFLVMYVDDSIMHLMLWWLLLLPVGRTLILSDWLAHRGAAWQRWKEETVAGANLRFFLCNLALMYLVAGLWKWNSPMWREGTALYAVLKLPISRAPDFWGPQHLPMLRIANWFFLVLEPLLALIVIFPKRSFGKYVLLASLLSFHLGIIVTVGLPVANFGCLAALVLVFRGELMCWIRGRAQLHLELRPAPPRFSNVLAFAFVLVLTMAMLSSVLVAPWRTPARDLQAGNEARQDAAEGLGTLQKVFFTPLWDIGIAQQYQLFNWIDDRNFRVRRAVPHQESVVAPKVIDLVAMFPNSTRGVLLQTYLDGITWMNIPGRYRPALKRSIMLRLAKRYCREFQVEETVEVYSTLERINPESAEHNEQRAFIMQFSCEDAKPRIEAFNVNH
jgi:hypothetical protein